MRCSKEPKVLEAAKAVFLRYGYRRTTMGDIAAAAGISRPALYLMFCNKERVFEATLKKLSATLLEDIRTGIAETGTPMEKLRLAFEHWAVRPFKLMLESPDAEDLIQCNYGFAKGVMDQSQAAFEAQLIAILETVREARHVPGPSLERVAHVLSASVHGLKGVARDVSELRDMIDALLQLAVSSLASGNGAPQQVR
jgi:AcrR family transcriptional regulator